MLDLVLAADLPGDELGVVDALALVGAERTGAGEPEQQAAVLGDVVRHDPEELARLVEDVAVRRRDDRGGGRGPRVAPGAAVHVDDDLHPRYSSVSIGGNSPGMRERRRSRIVRCSLGSAPRARRSDLRRSMMTFTFGSSL